MSTKSLSRRQQTLASLFPGRSETTPRAKRVVRPHQLGLGVGFARRPAHCVGCGLDLRGLHDCPACGAFTCEACDAMTSPNGGNGRICFRCLR